MEQGTQMKHPSRFAKWSLVVGIVIVLNMFFNYAISLVYKAPEYPQPPQVVGNIETQADCLAVGGQWNANVYNVPDTKTAPTGYCDPDYTNRKTYEDAHKAYNRNVFIVLVILGIISIIVGVVATQEVLSTAFSWGGVLSLLIASMRYWSDAGNGIKVAILAVALVGLIYVAVKKFTYHS